MAWATAVNHEDHVGMRRSQRQQAGLQFATLTFQADSASSMPVTPLHSTGFQVTPG
jgi:hypothetical protein